MNGHQRGTAYAGAPIGYGMEVDTILHSASLKTDDNNYTGYNPMANKNLTYVEDATLNMLAGDNACRGSSLPTR